MNQQQVQQLLTVNQQNDYTWIALLPEMTSMWATGYSEDEARQNWLREYNQPMLAAVFASVIQERAKHPRITMEEPQARTVIQRPATVTFPYRGRLYRIATNEGLPKRHIVLPHGTILVVCQWAGRVPTVLADIRRSSQLIAPETIAMQLGGVLAEEIPLRPGQTTTPMAIFDFENQRYLVHKASNTIIELPDGRLYRTATIYPEEPVRIATVVPFSPQGSDTFEKTPAIPVAPDHPGMAREPRDIRIRFTVQGERFVLSHEAYEQGKFIVFVPGHGFFTIGTYLQSIPVQLGDLSRLSVDPANLGDVAAALRFADAVDTLPQGPHLLHGKETN